MILALKTVHHRFSRQQYPLLLASVYAVLFVITLQNYIVWQSVNFILGLIALSLAPLTPASQKNSTRFGIAALCCAAIYLVLPAKTVLYTSLVLALFFLVESFYGRINPLLCGIVVLMSPLFDYAMNVFSFPIRLQVTAWAGKLLSFTGTNTRVEGNMIYSNGHEFSVDAACMGLHMLVTALLCGIMLIILHQQRYRQVLKKKYVIAILAIIFGLNILTNLCRIVCLVQFAILPDTPLHDIIGIVCLAVYVILPAQLLSKWAVKRLGQPVPPKAETSVTVARKSTWAYHLALLLIIAGVAGVPYLRTPVTNKQPHQPVVPGYTLRQLPGGIAQLENAHSLVYLKQIPGFYYPDHHPMICWKGSGYAFVKVQEQNMGGMLMYTAVLQQENEQLYTAWWYDNGYHATINQLDWRWDAFCSRHNYSLVNITAASRKQLEASIATVLQQQPFRPLLQ